MPSVVSIHGSEFHVLENRESVMQRVMSADAEPLSDGGRNISPLGWLRLTDAASNAELIVRSSSIGHVRHG